ncbi:MAG: GNAT family N-acetyltransferase, partial [Pseudobdellovibrionaceae bacterium]
MPKTCFIKPEETYHLRQTVLRPGRPLEESMFEGDFSSSTFHVGTFDVEKIQVVATLHEQLPPQPLSKFLNFSGPVSSYRLRGMAADLSARRKGYGKQTIRFAEEFLRSKKVDLLWFNARQVAYPFYSSLGYEFFGDEFEMTLIGP